MRTRRSWRNQNRLWRELAGAPVSMPRPVVPDDRPLLKTARQIQEECSHPMYEKGECVLCGQSKPRTRGRQ